VPKKNPEIKELSSLTSESGILFFEKMGRSGWETKHFYWDGLADCHI